MNLSYFIYTAVEMNFINAFKVSFCVYMIEVLIFMKAVKGMRVTTHLILKCRNGARLRICRGRIK